MEPVTLVRDIMTTDVTTTWPEVSLLSVAKMFSDKKFNGIPVVDKQQKLLG
jgi:CBS domain-containing protein